MKKTNYLYYIALLCMIAGGGFAYAAHSWATARPIPDFKNMPAYITALERSQDPQMLAFKREISAGPRRLAREKRLALAAGITFSLPKIQINIPPSRENAAPIYEQLRQLDKTSPMPLPDYAQPLVYGFAYSPKELKGVQQTLATYHQQITLLVQAANKPYCVFPYKWIRVETRPVLETPYLAIQRQCARTLNTQCYLLATQRHYAQAIQRQMLGYHIAKQPASGPGTIHLLVGVAIDAITAQGMKNILYLAGPNEAVDTHVQRTVLKYCPRFELKPAMLSEASDELMLTHSIKLAPKLLSNYLGISSGSAPALTPQQTVFTIDMIDAAEAQYLHDIREMLPIANQSDPARLNALRQIAQSQQVTPITHKPNLDPVVSFMRGSLMTNYAQVVNKIDYAESGDQIIAASASVLAIKAKTGAFPQALPGRFIDPFDGKELGYRREGKNGFVVYSVGPHGTFDGGKPGYYLRGGYEQDFRYPAPSLKPVPAYMLN